MIENVLITKQQEAELDEARQSGMTDKQIYIKAIEFGFDELSRLSDYDLGKVLLGFYDVEKNYDFYFNNNLNVSFNYSLDVLKKKNNPIYIEKDDACFTLSVDETKWMIEKLDKLIEKLEEI